MIFRKWIVQLSFLFIFPRLLEAEYWICHDKKSGAERFTNTPTVNDSQTCKPFGLTTSPFSRLPKGSMDRFSNSIPLLSYDKPLVWERTTRSRNEPGNFAKTSFRAKDINSKYPKKSAHGLNRACLLKGNARSRKALSVEIQVTRGALTKDSLSLVLPGEMKAVPWELSLKGPCRSPSVIVVPRG